MQKAILAITIIVLTICCVVGFIYKQKKSTPPLPPNNNWQWKDDWGAPDQAPPSSPPEEEPSPPPPPPPKLPSQPTSSYQEALQRAERERKPILLIFSTSWCAPCQKMKQETLSHPQVTQAINTRYISLSVDAEKERNISNKFQVTSVPTLVITNGREQVIKKSVGFMDANAFLRWLN